MDPQTESLLHSIADTVHIPPLLIDTIAHGISQPEADRVAAEVDHYRELLALYDRERV